MGIFVWFMVTAWLSPFVFAGILTGVLMVTNEEVNLISLYFLFQLPTFS